MAVSITNHVDITVSLEGSSTQPAGFGNLCFVTETTVGTPGTDRLVGPFTSLAELVTYGFTSSDAAYNAASAIFSQNPRVKKLYIGRRLAGDASLTEALNAIEAAGGALFYGVAIENRTDAQILELAAWCESRFKIAMAQTAASSALNGYGRTYTAVVGGTEADGDYDLIFTGFGLPSPVTVTTTRAGGTPATNALIAAALEAELETQNGVAGDIEGVLLSITVDSATITFTASRDVAAGTITSSAPSGATITVATTDDDVARQMFDAGYTRTALVYHDDDTEYLECAYMSKGMAFNLDQKKGIWAYLQLNGVSGTDITSLQATELRNMNVNYFSPILPTSGVVTRSYTAQGWFPFGTAAAGRRIDVTTSLDWLQARLEEAILNVLLRATHGVPYTDAGLNQIGAAVRGVFNTGVAAGHLLSFVVPDGEDYAGQETPLVVVPLLSETSTADRAARTMTFSALAYLRSAIERVTFSVEIRQ